LRSTVRDDVWPARQSIAPRLITYERMNSSSIRLHFKTR
jgi:hypothetical protein